MSYTLAELKRKLPVWPQNTKKLISTKIAKALTQQDITLTVMDSLIE